MKAAKPTSTPFSAALMLGFAFSGFFDGILLHQILQWHHLLSLLEPARSLRTQILADGLFHALMYLVAAWGLWRLYRVRGALADAGGARRLWGGVLIGFGAWNFVDVSLFHWILNLHHIRLDVGDPVVWDVGWLVVFGLFPCCAGAWVLRLRGPPGSGAIASASVIVLALTGGGAWNLRPPPARGDVLVVFAPSADVFSTAMATDARVIQLHRDGSVAVMRLAPGRSALSLYRHGAMAVQGVGPAGCLNWSAPTAGA
jgi:uncharacterized membrane protein